MFSINIAEEKKYLYEMMQDITKERRTLTDMYFDAKKRIDDLNRLEEDGMKDLNINGYVDMRNEANRKRMIDNIQRESEYKINQINQDSRELSGHYQEPSLFNPHEIAEQRYRDNVNSGMSNKRYEEEREEIKPQSNSTTAVKEKPKTKSKPKSTKEFEKGKHRFTSEEIQNIFQNVEDVLKEEGIPMNNQQVLKKINKRMNLDMDVKYFRQNIFFRCVGKNDNISKVSKGYYQYDLNNQNRLNLNDSEDSDNNSED